MFLETNAGVKSEFWAQTLIGCTALEVGFNSILMHSILILKLLEQRLVHIKRIANSNTTTTQRNNTAWILLSEQ